MWSFGCIAVELLHGTALFRSKTITEQLLEIIKKLGTPTQDDMANMNPNYSLKEF